MQRHQAAIDGINASIQRLGEERQRVSTAIEAHETGEAQRVDNGEDASRERPPSPRQDDVMRWNS